jgi:hypothetical protein
MAMGCPETELEGTAVMRLKMLALVAHYVWHAGRLFRQGSQGDSDRAIRTRRTGDAGPPRM